MHDKEIHLAKDFIVIENNHGKLMFVILHKNKTGEPNSDAKIIFGKGPHAVLIKNDDHATILDYMDKDTVKIMQNAEHAIITEIDYNKNLIEYNLKNNFGKDEIHKLFEFAEAHHSLKACYEVALEKIHDFDERFMHFIDKELEEREHNGLKNNIKIR
jgi:hypothetical protein